MKHTKASLADLDRESLLAYQAGRAADAIAFCAQAIKLAPANDIYKMRYAYFIDSVRITQFDPGIKMALTACLKSTSIDHQRLGTAWCSLLSMAPTYNFLFSDDIEERSYRKNIDMLLNDDFFLLGIRHLIIADVIIEQALTRLRKILLQASQDELGLRGKHLPLLSALGIQCFYNEFIWQESAAETSLLDTLDLTQPAMLALFACYRPLASHRDASAWQTTHSKGPLAALIQTQIDDVRSEHSIKESLPSFSPVQETTSRAVQAMYEENPYPRWRSLDIPPQNYPAITADWLSAGCGTGRPLTFLSHAFPSIVFTAIDLSRSSLGYAARKVGEAGKAAVNFYQGDILDIAKLGKDFDFIESSGVLHHMKDPIAGWKALLSCLRPGGRMQIGLYSKMARDDVEQVRTYIKDKGYTADLTGIRQLRADIMALPANHPLSAITHSRDFFTTSECRDLVFHVQEHTYTLKDISDMLDDLDMVFLGFKLRSPIRALYSERFPTDTAMTNLDNWHLLEQEKPGLFAGMYKFFCCRKSETDRPNDVWTSLEQTGVLASG